CDVISEVSRRLYNWKALSPAPVTWVPSGSHTHSAYLLRRYGMDCCCPPPAEDTSDAATATGTLLLCLDVIRKEPVEFDKVAIYFSKDEWDYLTEEQKELYKDVMMENYQFLRSLGCVNVTPEIVSMIERGEEPYIRGHQQYKKKESPTDNSTADGLMSRNSPEGYHILLCSPDCVMEDSSVTQMYHRANHISE
ncbi:hypothetical protein FKM82_028171, partial [Ascaphus truei]